MRLLLCSCCMAVLGPVKPLWTVGRGEVLWRFQRCWSIVVIVASCCSYVKMLKKRSDRQNSVWVWRIGKGYYIQRKKMWYQRPWTSEFRCMLSVLTYTLGKTPYSWSSLDFLICKIGTIAKSPHIPHSLIVRLSWWKVCERLYTMHYAFYMQYANVTYYSFNSAF